MLDDYFPASFPEWVIRFVRHFLHKNNSLRLSHDPCVNLRTPSTVRLFLAE